MKLLEIDLGCSALNNYINFSVKIALYLFKCVKSENYFLPKIKTEPNNLDTLGSI